MRSRVEPSAPYVTDTNVGASGARRCSDSQSSFAMWASEGGKNSKDTSGRGPRRWGRTSAASSKREAGRLRSSDPRNSAIFETAIRHLVLSNKSAEAKTKIEQREEEAPEAGRSLTVVALAGFLRARKLNFKSAPDRKTNGGVLLSSTVSSYVVTQFRVLNQKRSTFA